MIQASGSEVTLHLKLRYTAAESAADVDKVVDGASVVFYWYQFAGSGALRRSVSAFILVSASSTLAIP